MSSTNSWSKAMLVAASAASVFAPAQAVNMHHRPSGYDRVLMPAVHWDMDRSDLQGLVPQKKGPLYFADHPGLQDRRVGHTYANVDAEWDVPTVVLEHSKYISNVTCTDAGMAITISHDKAYERAMHSWEHAGEHGLGLVSYYPGCGKTRPDTRSFWKTKNFSFVKQPVGGVALVEAKETDFKGAIQAAKLKWGHYTPSADLVSRLSGSHTFDINISPDNSANSPWGPGVLITGDGSCDPGTGGSTPPPPPGGTPNPSPTPNARRSLGSTRHQTPAKRDGTCLDLYCVGCGAQGSLTVEGEVDIHLTQAPTVSVTFSGNLDATVQLGVVANEEVTQSFPKDIASIPIPGFGIPDVFAIGPQVDISVELDLTLHAAGELEAGATLSIPQFSTTFGTDGSSDPSNQGFSPSISQTSFQAAGEIGLTATFGVPISLAFGLTVPAANINETIALIETPSLSIDGTYNDGTCPGAVDVSASVSDSIDLNLFNIKTFNLFSATSPSLFQSCVSL